jgi:hypothetical protein
MRDEYFRNYATLNGTGIPKGSPETENFIGMDTKTHREGVHLWIGHFEVKDKHDNKDEFNKAPLFKSESVHLTREDARNLIKEIEERLF